MPIPPLDDDRVVGLILAAGLVVLAIGFLAAAVLAVWAL
jgi:hypothetical protein